MLLLLKTTYEPEKFVTSEETPLPTQDKHFRQDVPHLGDFLGGNDGKIVLGCEHVVIHCLPEVAVLRSRRGRLNRQNVHINWLTFSKASAQTFRYLQTQNPA